MTKYDIPDNYEWRDEKEAKQQQEEWMNRANVDAHSVTVIYDEEQEYQTAEKYECRISHSYDDPVVYCVHTFQNKGNYWRKRDVDDWIDFRDMPMPARKCVAETLDMTVQELTADQRLVEQE